MSLLCWLPLTGNTNNNGVGSIVISGNQTYDNAGKIGKCLNSNGTTGVSISALAGSRTWSVAFWGYVTSSLVTGNWTRIIQIGDGGTNLRVEVCPASYGSGVYCYSTHNNSSYKITSGSITDVSGGHYDKWMHFCITSDGTTIRVYRDGVASGSSAYDGSGTITGGFNLENNDKIKKNDFRVYDHCLSPKEVEILARGLVVHYKMDGGGKSGTQLYTGSHDFSGSWGNSGNWTTDTDTYNGFVVKKRIGAWSGLSQNITATQGDKFTISFWAKVESGGTVQSIHRSNLGNVTTGLSIIGGNFTSSDIWVTTGTDGTQWRYCWAALEVVSTDITYVQWRIENSKSDKTMWICGFKMERGSVATPWCPHVNDTYYTTMGYNDAVEYDVSGYKYNATKIGTFDYSSDTPRYSVSTIFNGTDSTLDCGNAFHVQGAKNISFSCWAWCEDYSTADSKYFISSQQTGGIVLYYISGTTARGRVHAYTEDDLSAYAYKDAGIAITLSGWHMFTCTYDTTAIKLYIDGELKKTTTVTTYGVHFHNTAHMFIGAESAGSSYSDLFNGKISDVRIYYTTLTADQVKELYSTSASISNNGTLMAYEFVEQ
jgi:hypothetical protein